MAESIKHSQTLADPETVLLSLISSSTEPTLVHHDLRPPVARALLSLKENGRKDFEKGSRRRRKSWKS